MCGIAGIWGPGDLPLGRLEAVADALRHRGPDGHGFAVFQDGEIVSGRNANDVLARAGRGAHVALVHTRLSIIDLQERSDQPMIDRERGLALVYNGEVYNFEELRRELAAAGARFTTEGDTEVVLRAYEHWGDACIERFVGMWAFALLDTRRRLLLLSRDRFGIKPLFIARFGDVWGFASEIKALRAMAPASLSPSRAVTTKYLVSGLVDDATETFFEGVTRLPAANNGVVSGDWRSGPTVAPYWSLRERPVPDDPVTTFREAFLDSVRLHARSDVQVGSCLSGGLDSSAIVGVAENLRRAGSIPAYGHLTFGYVPAEENFSEERFMRAVAAKTGAELHLVKPSLDETRDTLMSVVAFQDEPFVTSSIVAQWFVFAAARDRGVKVMLDGQGADELLAGYHWYFRVIALAMLQRGDLAGYVRFATAHRRRYGTWPLSWGDVVGRSMPRVVQAAASVRAKLVASGRAPTSVANAGLPTSVVFTEDAHEQSAPLPFGGTLPHDLDDLLWRQLSTVSLPALLRYEDRNSMAHSIEARVPFLDHRLVELAFSLPAGLRLRGAETKYVLKAAIGALLPSEVLDRRDKIGFRASPRITWDLAASLQHELNANATGFEEEWFLPDAVSTILLSKDRSDASEALLWRVINAKLWLRHQLVDQ